MSERSMFLKDLYSNRTRPSSTVRLSLRRRGFIEIREDGYIAYIKVRLGLRGCGYGDQLIRYAKALYGDCLHSHATSSEGDSLLRKHGITVLTA